MKRVLPTISLAVLVATLAAATPALAQRVKDVGGNPTAAELEPILRPKHVHFFQRGVQQVPPECKHYRDKMSRGVTLKPVADIASIRINFANDSSDLTPEDKASLDQLGDALKSSDLKPCCFEIDGYTDAVGGAALNQKLSEARAQSVVDYLGSHHEIDVKRMIPEGLGKTHFVASNATEEGRAENRRVQVKNLGYGDTKQ
jgi:outer membrane protein OmpA-like peptidoglycan-associated protein